MILATTPYSVPGSCFSSTFSGLQAEIHSSVKQQRHTIQHPNTTCLLAKLHATAQVTPPLASSCRLLLSFQNLLEVAVDNVFAMDVCHARGDVLQHREHEGLRSGGVTPGKGSTQGRSGLLPLSHQTIW